MKKFIIPSALALALAINSHAAEYFVDPVKGNDSNAGDASAPFKTILAAIKKAELTGGDTITLKGGVYREAISLTAQTTRVMASEDEPFIIQGAAGERAVITGFEPITGWKDAGNGIYTAEVPEFISGLFVGLDAQPLARWPRNGHAMLPFGDPDGEEFTFTVPDDGLAQIPHIEAIAADQRNVQMFMYINKPFVYGTKAIKSMDVKESKIFVENEKWWSNYSVTGDRFFHRVLQSRLPGVVRRGQ